MGKKNFWFKMEWDAWLTDEDLAACSLEAQGLWIRILCFMYRAETAELTGTVEQLRRKLGILPEELTRCLLELKNNNAADVRFCKDDVSIKSRRLERELKANEMNALYVARHREKVKSKVDVSTLDIDIDIDKDKEEESIESAPVAQPKKKGSRLPDPFFLTTEMKKYAAEKRPDVDVILETEKFCNHFRSAPGQKGVKLNWELTWKNWILNAGQYGKSTQRNGNGSNGKRSNADVLDEWAKFAQGIE